MQDSINRGPDEKAILREWQRFLENWNGVFSVRSLHLMNCNSLWSLATGYLLVPSPQGRG
jgi:hypothetical protein